MLKWVVFLVAMAIVAAATTGWMHRHRFRYPPSAQPAALIVELARQPGFTVEALEPEPGLTLNALVRAPTGAARGWIIFLAGNGAGVLASGQGFLQAVDPGPAWGLVALPYRGFDNAGGQPRLKHFRTDLQAWWRLLAARHGLRAESTHLVAFSLGTALALELAQQLQRDAAPLASITLLGSYDRIDVAPAGWWSRWASADRYDALGFAAGVASPVLLVHGVDDMAVPLVGAQRLARAIGSRAHLLELAGGSHVAPLLDVASHAAVREFILRSSPATSMTSSTIQSRGEGG